MNLTSLTSRTFSSPRHTTLYWEAGPAGGPLMIFVHGWPQIGLMWRAQVEAFASQKAGAASRQTCAATAAHRHRLTPTSMR
jgi:pimeloyl-ACP methyl ester carboxylesterase